MPHGGLRRLAAPAAAAAGCATGTASGPRCVPASLRTAGLTTRRFVARAWSGGAADPDADADEEAARASAEALFARRPFLDPTGARGGAGLAGAAAMHTKLQFMYSTQQLPDTYIGAIELAAAPGRGWGLMATAIIQPGDPIIICPPLALIAGPPGRPPGVSDLARLIAGARWLAPSRRLLEALSDGAAPRPHDAVPEAPAAAAAARGRGGGGSRRARSALEEQQEVEVLALLRRMGIDAEDAAILLEESNENGGSRRSGLSEEGAADTEAWVQDSDGGRGLAALLRDRAAAAAGAGGSSASKDPAAAPRLRELAAGLSDARQAGVFGSRPALRMEPER
jgi:hypothetical protein